MSYEDTILLKIKREFTQNEAVQQLLKMVSELELEIGMLKSEKAELQDKINKATNQGVKGKKLWLQDELFADLDRQLKKSKETQRVLQSQTNEWRNKYFSLMASRTEEGKISNQFNQKIYESNNY